MLDRFSAVNKVDGDGNPAGGSVEGVGLNIIWQNGPLGRGDARTEPNGAFVETVIAAVLQRIEFYQRSQFVCDENETAVVHLEKALEALTARTLSRESREVEGTHEV